MKKSRIRVLLMMLSVCFGTFFFGGETTAMTFEDFEYDTTNHGENIKITKYVGTAEEVVIPEEIDGKKVLTIGGAAFMSRNNITSVTIPDTVTGISGMAFSGCSGLEVVVLPNSVTTLGGGAFSGCSSLLAINLPANLATIDGAAFSNCVSLKSVTIPAGVTNIGEGAFSGCSGLTSLKVSEDNAVYDSREKCNAIMESATGKLIAGCENTVIPEDTKEIGIGAFSGCTGLASVRIPESVQAIGSSAFMGCIGLCRILLKKNSFADGWAKENSYTAIVVYEDDPFYYRVRENGAELLEYSGSDSRVMIPQTMDGITVTAIGHSLFKGHEEITEVTIPAGVKSIVDGAFSGCSGLSEMVLPKDVTMIGNEAFYGCSGLTGISIPNGVTEIGKSAFYGCSGLTSVDLPAGVTEIGDSAFYGCSGLTAVAIPEKVTGIGKDAFSGCAKLKTVTVKKGSYADSWAKEQGLQIEYFAEPEAATTEAASQPSTQTVTEAPQPSAQASTETGAQQTTEKPARKKAEISAKSYEKEYGCKAFSLKVTCDSDGKLTYESSNKKVAKVSAKGKVQVKGCGTAKLTIRSAQTDSYEAAVKTVTVRVVPGQVKGLGLASMADINKRKMLFVKWKKLSGVTGYEIRWSTKSFKSKQYKSKKISSAAQVYDIADFATVKKLKADYFYVRIRGYKKVGKKYYYGKWKTLKISGGA